MKVGIVHVYATGVIRWINREGGGERARRLRHAREVQGSQCNCTGGELVVRIHNLRSNKAAIARPQRFEVVQPRTIKADRVSSPKDRVACAAEDPPVNVILKSGLPGNSDSRPERVIIFVVPISGAVERKHGNGTR